MNVKLQTIKYVLLDAFAAALAWFSLFTYRKLYIEYTPIEFNPNFFYALLLIPIFWISLYVLLGLYADIYRRHRLKELGQIISVSGLGVIVLFFAFILDDQISNYKNYYASILVLFLSHFFFTFLFRIILTSQTVKRVHSGKIGFKTLILGGNDRALAMYEEILHLKKSPGFKFIGFVKVNGVDNVLEKHLPKLGAYSDLSNIVIKNQICEVIIALESSDHKKIGEILNQLEGLDVRLKIVPDMYDIMSGSVRMTSIFGLPLIQVNRSIMPQWQFTLKRLMDFSFSTLAILLLSPAYILIAVLVKLSSPGTIFFKQQRIGLHGKPFTIYKYRTMVENAEAKGPQLSSSNDSRITKLGKFLRKTRLDEFPQFFNVIKGDMALVGPRPERQHYIDLIMEQAPHYRHLQKVRPGITSWGQVKYGYAENVEQMIQRLKYDVIYIENMSLSVDFKILFYTILTVLKGDGK
jgi:exopolysaccharide biosynthesis polyprenyl glycosylphosphotransferase